MLGQNQQMMGFNDANKMSPPSLGQMNPGIRPNQPNIQISQQQRNNLANGLMNYQQNPYQSFMNNGFAQQNIQPMPQGFNPYQQKQNPSIPSQPSMQRPPMMRHY